MIKVLGSAIFLISLSAVGVKKATELRKSLRSITSAICVLSVYKSELSTSRAAMSKIAHVLSSSQDSGVRRFGNCLKINAHSIGEKDFSEIWVDAVKTAFNTMPDDCLRDLCALGAYIGRYEIDAQLEAVDRCISGITVRAEELKPKCALEGKMYIGLYSGIGLIVSVMLI